MAIVLSLLVVNEAWSAARQSCDAVLEIGTSSGVTLSLEGQLHFQRVLRLEVEVVSSAGAASWISAG